MSSIRPIAALGLRLAWSPQPAHRWRQASIMVTALVVAFIVAAGVAFVDAATAAETRELARRPVIGDDASIAALQIVSRANWWDGRQYPIMWLEGDESSPLPPGLDRLPEPGTAVVSPAVAADAVAVEALGYALSSAGTGEGGTIGDEGLVARSEWLVYARADRPLGARGVLSVTGFGPADSATPQLSVETDPAMPSGTLAIIMVLWLVILPSALLLSLAASSFSALRVSRAHTLHLLGVSRSAGKAIGALETAALAAPAAALGLGLWAWLAPHVQRLPGTGITLVDSALVVSLPAAALVGATVVAAMAVVGAIPTRAQRRSQVVRRRPRWVSVLPLGIGLAGMILAQIIGPPRGTPILIGTLLTTTASFPFAMPVMVQVLGGWVARSARPHRWLAGRRLSFSPSALARPALGVGMLVLIVGSATGIYLKMQAFQSHESEEGVYTANWFNPRAGDVDLVRDLLPGATIEASGGTDSSEQTIKVSGESLTVEDVQAAVLRFPGGNADARGQATMRPQLSAGWVAGGALLAGALLVLAALHSFANRALMAFREDDDLLALGLEDTQVQAVQRWTMAAPLVVVIPVAVVGALAFTGSANSVELSAVAAPQILAEAALAAIASGLVILFVGRLQRQRLKGPRRVG